VGFFLLLRRLARFFPGARLRKPAGCSLAHLGARAGAMRVAKRRRTGNSRMQRPSGRVRARREWGRAAHQVLRKLPLGDSRAEANPNFLSAEIVPLRGGGKAIEICRKRHPPKVLERAASCGEGCGVFEGVEEVVGRPRLICVQRGIAVQCVLDRVLISWLRIRRPPL